MATADEYAAWIVKNADKKGTPEFDTVAAAYKDARQSMPSEAAPSEIPGPRTRKDLFAQELRQLAAPFAGFSSGAGNIMFGGQRLLGKGLEAAGGVFAPDQTMSGLITGKQPTNMVQQAGAFLQEDAAQRLAQEQATVAPFKRDFPMATGAGELGAEVLATAPVSAGLGALVAKAAPALGQAIRTGGFSTGRAVQSGASRAADLGIRAAGGAITGGATAALVNPADAETGALAGAGVAVLAPPIVKGLAKSAGFLVDAFSGKLAQVGAGKIARDVAGDRIGAIRAALMASPADVTAAQATSGIQKDAWQALGAMTSKTDDVSALLKRQAADDLASLQRMAEGGNATEARSAYEQSIQRLNQLTADMRAIELQAANQAGQTINQLAPKLEQRQASMVNALRGGIPVGQALPGQATISPITEAAQQATIAAKGKPGFLTAGDRSQEWQATSDIFADLAKQRRAEAGLIERQIGSLEDYGLRPLDAGGITAAIDAKLAAPGLRASSNMTKVLSAIRDDIINLTEKGGGVIDAHDLYTLRKEGISERIAQIMGQTDPKVSAKVTRSVLQEVRPLIDDAIEAAAGPGGPGWKNYLKTYSQGMQAIDQKAMAAEAARLFGGSEADKQAYVRLVRGNNIDAVEAIFGPGSYDIFKEMGSKMPTLEKVASNVERNAAMKESAVAGTEALGKIIGEDSFRLRFPAFFSPKITAANMTLDILEKKLDKKVFSELQKGMLSGKSALEMLDTLPTVEKSKALKALADPTSWAKIGGATTRAAAMPTAPTNSLAPVRINLNNMNRPDRP
jgi:hypothetical protein